MFEKLGREMGETIRKAEHVLSLYEKIQTDHQLLQQRELTLQKKIFLMKRIMRAILFLFLLSNLCWLLFIIHNYSQN